MDASLADLEKVAFGHICVDEHACVGELGEVKLGEHVEHGRRGVLCSGACLQCRTRPGCLEVTRTT